MKIHWIPGKSNLVADAMSRNPDFALNEQETKDRLEKTILPATAFEESENITDNKDRQLEVKRLYHDHPLAGHFGFKKTLDLIQRKYWWKNMLKDIKAYTQSCDVCQKSKTTRQAPPGKLIPLPIPDRNWQHITMDMIVKLPTSQKHDSILVIVDRRSKMAHLIPTNETITAEGTAKLVFDHIVCKHGVPHSIITDRGPQFKSHFWKKLWELLGSKAVLSTAYHQETDGQSERVNQTLKQYLRCFTSYNQDDWCELLPTAEFAYNNSYNESIGMSPLYAVTGQDAMMEHLGVGTTPVTNPPQAGRIKEHFDTIYKQLQKHLEAAQTRYKKTADVHRASEPEYKINEIVLLSTKNVRTDRPTKKLDYTF
ncbi:hypothetical protein SeLEV6574_g07991, partial [Synchytrium endobioticum]